MSELIERPLTAEEYEELARAYAATLPLEHFMESIPQSTQRIIAMESLELVKSRRPEVQLFSELLVQYWVNGELRRVVPDNMVRLGDRPPVTKGSFNIALEPVRPLWVLEWVSDSSEGKDYGDAFRKYERDLRVPYCLSYHPEDRDFRFYRHTGKRYELIEANENGRFPLPELDLEVGLLGDWVRFWFAGKLLDLPLDLQKRIDKLETRLQTTRRELNKVRRRAKAGEERAEQEQQRAEQEQQRADREQQRADREGERAQEQEQRAEKERQARLAVEKELAEMRSQLANRKNASGLTE